MPRRRGGPRTRPARPAPRRRRGSSRRAPALRCRAGSAPAPVPDCRSRRWRPSCRPDDEARRRRRGAPAWRTSGRDVAQNPAACDATAARSESWPRTRAPVVSKTLRLSHRLLLLPRVGGLLVGEPLAHGMCRLAGVLPSGSPWSARRALAEHGLALRAPVVGNAEADLPRGVHVDLEVAVTHHLDVQQQPARLDDHGAHTLGTSKEFIQAAARALYTGAECLQDRGALAVVQVEVVVLLRVVPLLVVVPIVRHHSRLLLGRALITRPPAQRASAPRVRARAPPVTLGSLPPVPAADQIRRRTRRRGNAWEGGPSYSLSALLRGTADCARRTGVNREYRDGQCRSLLVTLGSRAGRAKALA